MTMMILPSSRSSNFLFCVILWLSTEVLSVFSQQELEPELEPELELVQKQDDLVELVEDPLAVLGEEDTTTLRSSWGMTVNDQCLYEFVYQFEHLDSLPIGDDAFKGTCEFENLEGEEPKLAPDGIPYLEPRRFYERFPNYVWATMGFNHLSVDWLPCGRQPAGYKTAQYDFSFFRVTPEYRAQTMVCKLVDEDTGITTGPGEKTCAVNQEDPNGMNFFIVPGAMSNRDPVVNMPVDFTHLHQSYGPVPHYGLRSWDQDRVPATTNEWNDIPIFMSSYAGNLVMWQALVQYKMISGEKKQFHSGANRYFETTIQTLPDTWAVKYDESDGTIRLTMVGKAEICRGDFERAQKAAGGTPTFPNYDFVEAEKIRQKEADEKAANDERNEDEEEILEPGSSSSFTSSFSSTVIQLLMLFFALKH